MDEFKVTFYGVRGSIPTPATGNDTREKLDAALARATPEDLASPESRRAFVDGLPPHISGVIGGNSSCVHIKVGGHHLIFDGGSGIRVLGLQLAQQEFGKGKGQAHIFFTHTHWDHILGIPFFVPLFIPGNNFNICACHEDIESRLRGQQQFQYFPISFDYFGSHIQFTNLKPLNEFKLGPDIRVTWKEMDHPGQSYSYRVDYKGKSVIFSTDAEYRSMEENYLQPTVDFFKNADVVIFDSQYTMVECIEKEDWGHSSTFIGIDLALKANVKKMAFFHHEPTYSDFKLMEIYDSSVEFLKAVAPESPLHLLLAREGLTIDLFAT